jgi:signal transduction histidine kinase
MINILNRIKRKLSLKLSFGIMLFLIVVFIVSLGILFIRSRQMVRDEAMSRAEQELENIVMRVNGMMKEVEVATATAEWHLTDDQLQPDSLLYFARRIVAMNPNFDGCSISMEPNYFPQIGRYFSVYAYHKGDSVVAKVESPYDYFDKVYYKTPATLGKPSWVEAYAEYTNGTVSQEYDDLIVSFGVPLRNSKREVIGVISTDLSMPWLSEVISGYKPYPNAYSIMLGADGQYLIHPDTTKLMKKTVFSDTDTKNNQDLITLGHDMISGNSGMLTVNIRDKRCMVLYKSLRRAPWSIALVCPESDILAGYTKLLYILIPLLVFGLLVILAFCLNVITSMVTPINELTDKLSYITNGHYNEPIEKTSRRDVIGRLQNNFAEMQEALSKQINSLQEVNIATEKLNNELQEASVEARKADESKSEFLKDVTHQIRTPLNIINGFTQVLRDDAEALPKEEVETIVDTMQTNAINMNRMINMLLVAANSDKNVKINVMEEVNVHELVETLTYLYANNPPYTVDLITDVRLLDTFTVKSNREFLGKALVELLYNAKKFTTDGHVKLTVRAVGITVVFVVEDTGPGISEETQAKLFDNFEKGNIFTEGLGMGLPTCRQMVRMIGGELKYDATYTEGSRFVIVIPNSHGEVELR